MQRTYTHLNSFSILRNTSTAANIGFDSRSVPLTGHRLEPKCLNFIELRDAQIPETRFRGLQTTLKRRLRGGSNLFALGPPTT